LQQQDGFDAEVSDSASSCMPREPVKPVPQSLAAHPAEPRVAELDGERRRRHRSANEQQEGKKPSYFRPRLAAIRMRSAFNRMNPAASA